MSPAARASGTSRVAPAPQVIGDLLDEIHTSMYDRALAFQRANTHEPSTYADFADAVDDGFASIWWCEQDDCERAIREDAGATSRCIPLEQPGGTGICLRDGRPGHPQGDIRQGVLTHTAIRKALRPSSHCARGTWLPMASSQRHPRGLDVCLCPRQSRNGPRTPALSPPTTRLRAGRSPSRGLRLPEDAKPPSSSRACRCRVPDGPGCRARRAGATR